MLSIQLKSLTKQNVCGEGECRARQNVPIQCPSRRFGKLFDDFDDKRLVRIMPSSFMAFDCWAAINRAFHGDRLRIWHGILALAWLGSAWNPRGIAWRNPANRHGRPLHT